MKDINPRVAFRSMLNKSSGISVFAGAHDALSARIIEQTGFAGVWASSYGMSLAGRCLPDTDLVTMSEHLEAVRAMVSAVHVPVIADCNSGYGSVSNVIRLTQEFERAGVAGICIEDNEFPKRCSLYEGWHRRLVRPEEMAAKISSAKTVQEDPDFVVVARIESLIAGETITQAIERAYRYEDAGADAIVVHARQLEPLVELLGRVKLTQPLMVIPTLFGHVSLEELRALGYRIVIYANQAIRAAIKAMRSVLETLKDADHCWEVEPSIESLNGVNTLLRMEMFRQAEHSEAGLPESHILAAR